MTDDDRDADARVAGEADADERGPGDLSPGSAVSWRRALVIVWTLVGIGLLLRGMLQFVSEPLQILFPPLLFAGILVYLLAPVVDRLAGLRLPRVVATLLTYLLAAALMVGLGAIIVPLFTAQLGELVDELPAIVTDVRAGLERALSTAGLQGLLPDPTDGEALAEWVASMFEGSGDSVIGALGLVRALVGSVVSGVVGLVLAPVLAFYLLTDLPRVIAGIQRMVPPAARDEVTDVARRILATVGAYFRGQLLVATFVGVATAIGMALIGLPFWAIIGGMAGVFNLIPFIGPTTGAVTGVVVALTVGDGLTQAIIVVVVMVVVQQLDNHVITPNILARTVHVHPVTIIVALIAAATMFGLLGMLVAIPTLAAGKLVILYLLATRVPAMAHLSDPDQFLDGAAMPPARPGSLAGLSQQLRAAWLKRRQSDGQPTRIMRDVPVSGPASPDAAPAGGGDGAGHGARGHGGGSSDRGGSDRDGSDRGGTDRGPGEGGTSDGASHDRGRA